MIGDVKAENAEGRSREGERTFPAWSLTSLGAAEAPAFAILGETVGSSFCGEDGAAPAPSTANTHHPFTVQTPTVDTLMKKVVFHTKNVFIINNIQPLRVNHHR